MKEHCTRSEWELRVWRSLSRESRKQSAKKKIEVCALCGTLRLTRRVSSGALTSISFAVLFLDNLRDGLYRKEGTASSLMRAQNLNM